MRKAIRIYFIPLICQFVFLLFSLFATAQQNKDYRVYLKSGPFIPPKNINAETVSLFNKQIATVTGKNYLIIQFEKIPSEAEKQFMLFQGIRLLEYLPSKAYICEVTGKVSFEMLRKNNARAFFVTEASQKMDASIDDFSSKRNDSIIVLAAFYSSFNYETGIELLKSKGFIALPDNYRDYNVVQISIPLKRLSELASFPFIQYIEKTPPKPTPLDFTGSNNSKANVLQSALPGGYNLTGEGVMVGVGEIVGAPQEHIDFADRIKTGGLTSLVTNDSHATFVNGILGGAGLLNERYKGYAPKVNLISPDLVGPGNIPAYLKNYGMVLTNNSYALGGGPCITSANPGISERIYEMLAIRYPVVQNVFAVGNSGETGCVNGYPPGFNTIAGTCNGGKSNIAVGIIWSDGQVHVASSKGPANGGRIKPDLVAIGVDVIATRPVNTYGYGNGSSYASPAVTGGLALLYQRYKQLHNNQNPNAALIKSIICNTATDAGNAGPDFSYGFGKMNLYRAVKVLDSGNFFMDSVADNAVNVKTISVPAGVAQLKVLLYWQDPATSLLSTRSIVNDLDIMVTTPSGSIKMPYTLDTTAANVAAPATFGEDHVNNIEQVVIDLPEEGVYKINIKGTEIGQNPVQEYFVTYDILPNDVLLTFPFGDEKIIPGEDIAIQWDSWGVNNSTFKLEFSLDKGIKWQLIDANIPAEKRQFNWLVPDVKTTTALVRITRNNDSKTNSSKTFTVIGTPIISLSAGQCPGSITLKWDSVSRADHYEVMKLENGEMIVIDTVSATSFTFDNLSVDSTYWVTVRSVINNHPGLRAAAISRKPDDGDCTAVIFDNDLKADAFVISPNVRKFTSTGLTQNQEIILKIRNHDNKPATNYTVSYAVDNGNWVVENATAPIPALSTFSCHFIKRHNFSQPGDYVIRLAVTNKLPDLNQKNDTLQYTIHQLSNEPIDLALPFVERFDQAQSNTYSDAVFGMAGIERFDYVKTSGTGNLTFPFNEMTDSSGKSLKLGNSLANIYSLQEQSVIATFNLSAYDTSRNKLGLIFNISSVKTCTGCNKDSSNFFIRGNDTMPWIRVLKLNPEDKSFTNKKIEIPGLEKFLSASSQNFSSSFQMKWQHIATLNNYLLDNIILYNAANDLGIIFSDSLPSKDCNLGVIPIKIKVTNNSKNDAINTKVYYAVNSGSTVTENLSLIPAGESVLYTFNTLANLTGIGYKKIETGVIYPNDSYPDNNTQTITIRNQPLITKFPYLENFEEGDGGWYTEGRNSSWALGKPGSNLINKAASGDNAWKTNLIGNHNANELSYLYSPCIDYSGLQHPAISFSMALNMDSCIVSPSGACESIRIQYSTNGVDWAFIPLSTINGYNWKSFWTSETYYRWHVATGILPVSQGAVQFRFMFRSDGDYNFEGVAIDDLHIYERGNSIYDTTLSGIPVTQSITRGNNWINFLKDQKIIASINPYGQNLGNTILKAFIKPTTPVSNFHGQYYLNRSFIIDAENKKFSDSIGIRLYYLDKESDSLLFALKCPNCSKPADAYRFGISQYSSDGLSKENDTISDNTNGSWSFIENKKMKIVPYDKGYYAEFKVKDFSELRLNSGGSDKQSYLPLNILNFSATKNANTNTYLAWTVASEINIKRYEIEVASGNDAFANNQFLKLGEVTSPGSTVQNRSYTFLDIASAKTGALYYRVKAIDEFSNYFYSKTIPILYSKELVWKIFPNPSHGLFSLQYQLSEGETGTIKIYNSIGQIFKTQFITGNGYVQTTSMDFTKASFHKGLYLARIVTKASAEVFKILIE